MIKEEFARLLQEAIHRATSSFSRVSGKVVPEPKLFEVHAPDPAGRVVSANETLDAIFLNEFLFYKVIDVGLIARGNAPPIGFIRVSGHAPCAYGETLNPEDLGPFNVLEPLPTH